MNPDAEAKPNPDRSSDEDLNDEQEPSFYHSSSRDAEDFSKDRTARADSETGLSTTAASTMPRGGGSGSRGPIGPRPGVFRPCARCRLKKTKCDRLKPACSNCQKGGLDVACVYDNDEPIPGASTAPSSDPVSPFSSPVNDDVPKQTKTTTKRDTTKGPTSKSQSSNSVTSTAGEPEEALMAGGSPYSRSASEGQGAEDYGHTTDGGNKADLSIKKPSQELGMSSQSSPPSGATTHSLKKIKTGSSTSTAIRPSPLRTSITTDESQASPISPPFSSLKTIGSKRKASTSSGSPTLLSRQEGDEDAYAGNKEETPGLEDRDEVVSGLSIRNERDQGRAPTPTPIHTTAVANNRQGNMVPRLRKPLPAWLSSTPAPTPTPTATPSAGSTASKAKASTNANSTAASSTVNSSSSNGGGGGGGNSGGNQGKIMVDFVSRVAAPPPPVPFVIDKNQRARKWGKSLNIFQTLGGEVTISLWSSDQEMLLNEPKPIPVQQAAPFASGGRKDSELARLAVLRDMDVDMDYVDSPERGNTPDSIEGSPGPGSSTALAAPAAKKKRMFKKHISSVNAALAQDESAAHDGSKKSAVHKKRVHAESGNSAAVDTDRDGTPTPVPVPTGGAAAMAGKSSSRPVSIPSQRPRTFPCLFEGCGKSFMDKFHLDRHEARHVTEEIVCGIDGCTKAYPSISTVRRHQSIVHKDKKEELEQQRQQQKQQQKQQKQQQQRLQQDSDSESGQGEGNNVDDDGDGDKHGSHNSNKGGDMSRSNGNNSGKSKSAGVGAKNGVAKGLKAVLALMDRVVADAETSETSSTRNSSPSLRDPTEGQELELEDEIAID